MVALLVIFTIIGCLAIDTIVVSVRERKAVIAISNVVIPELIFIQDGGEPIEKEKE